MNFTVHEFITPEDLQTVKIELLSKEQLKDLKRKWRNISNYMKYSSRDHYLVAKDAFEGGYLATFIEYEIKEKL